MVAIKRGALLRGADMDLEDWATALPASGDPYVEMTEVGSVLCSSEFDLAESAAETYEIAEPLVELLNGLLGVLYGTEEVVMHAAVEFTEQGVRRQFMMNGGPLHLRKRRRPVPPNGGEISETQAYYDKAKQNIWSIEMLILSGRTLDWFDIYKSVEAVRKLFGGQHKLAKKSWVKNNNIDLVTHTADSLYRHVRGGKTPPPKPIAINEARAVVDQLIRDALRNHP